MLLIPAPLRVCTTCWPSCCRCCWMAPPMPVPAVPITLIWHPGPFACTPSATRLRVLQLLLWVAPCCPLHWAHAAVTTRAYALLLLQVYRGRRAAAASSSRCWVIPSGRGPTDENRAAASSGRCKHWLLLLLEVRRRLLHCIHLCWPKAPASNEHLLWCLRWRLLLLLLKVVGLCLVAELQRLHGGCIKVRHLLGRWLLWLLLQLVHNGRRLVLLLVHNLRRHLLLLLHHAWLAGSSHIDGLCLLARWRPIQVHDLHSLLLLL